MRVAFSSMNRNLRTMKKFILFLLLAVLIAPQGLAQDRKKDRQIRREERRIERAVMDSLRAIQENGDSVNVGYGYVKKSSLTNSVSSVKMRRNEVASYSDIGEYLQGRVPGLSVIREGPRYRFLIRGVATVNGTSEPLLVVDGVEVADISFLNPRDVQSVEVLKDASASIYGASGAFGVILITTRKYYE